MRKGFIGGNPVPVFGLIINIRHLQNKLINKGRRVAAFICFLVMILSLKKYIANQAVSASGLEDRGWR